ncbi:MASE1 domain-containing protein [Streptomyces himalayensis]|uniref:MASE1 domain-containing protein n=1 Tax=Streptomyces himalayensis TaxID=2820085 RepID=UPI002867B4A1|nr:MASE1 domain-containing protein [Streptomyces himalayensis]
MTATAHALRTVRHGRLPRHVTTSLQILALAAVYVGAAKLGLPQELSPGGISPLWPPAGFALAALLLFGLRMWPGIAIGAFCANVTAGPSVPAVLAITVGDTLAPICAYHLLHRAGFHVAAQRLRDVLALIFLGALAGMVVSATIGSSALVLTGRLPASGFWPRWSVWWADDARGVLVVTPLLLVLRSVRLPRGVTALHWVEAWALAGATIAAALSVNISAFLFMVFPCLIWAAFRFQLAGAAPCQLAISTLVMIALANRTGAFAHREPVLNVITFQAFNLATALTALLLSVIIAERNRTQQEIRQVCGQLAELVAELGPVDTTHRRPPPRKSGETPPTDDTNGAGPEGAR